MYYYFSAGRYKAEQSDSFYHITVTFARNGRFYRDFRESLYQTYKDMPWRLSKDGTMKEGKVQFCLI